MSINIKKLSASDIDSFHELVLLFEEVFEMKDFTMPDRQHLEHLLAKKSFFVFIAVSEGKVIGGLTAYVLDQYYSASPLVYVYDLAVKTEHQRKGIGKLLMANITDYSESIGAEEVFVQADEIDDYALEFYRSSGATGEKVIHFYYPLKPAQN